MLELITIDRIKPYIPYVNGSLQGISEKRKQKLIAGMKIGIERKIFDDVIDEIDGAIEKQPEKGQIIAPLWALAHAYAKSDAAREVLSFGIAKTATYIYFNRTQNTATIVHQALQNKEGIVRFGHGFFYDRQHYGLALNLPADQLPLEITSGLHLDDFIANYQYVAQFLFLMNENQLKEFSNRIIKGFNPLVNISSEQEKDIIQLSFGAYKGHASKYTFGLFDSSTNEDAKAQYIMLKPSKDEQKKIKEEMKLGNRGTELDY